MGNKRDWKKPELVVLTRNKPEEAVLQACKTSTDNGAEPTNNGCYTSFYGNPCDACEDLANS